MNLFTTTTPTPFTHLIARLPQPTQHADKLIWDNPPLELFGEIVKSISLHYECIWIETGKGKIRLPTETTALKLLVN